MIHPPAGHVLAASIEVGEHPHFKFLGMTFNVDTMYTTAIAAVITVVFLWWVARKATSAVPGRAQIAVETVLTQVRTYVQDAVGHDVPPWLVPLGFALFFFILFCNWFEWIPSGHHPERLGPPTADTNLTFALMVVVLIGYTYIGFKRKRTRYVTSMLTAKPAGVGAFIAIVIDQIANPLALALRLFGNVLAGGIMLAVISLLPWQWFWLFGPADVIWRIFDAGLILSIQAFIFAFLTILYFGFALAEEH
ncbi:MAG TPA: F0F1 ATP synthase subunit A [Mycobacteriales bacterium]|nr:F0F1 ATP synthase subunit A [Mycobacteriales bacterium]